jgi:hypothetical protein
LAAPTPLTLRYLHSTILRVLAQLSKSSAILLFKKTVGERAVSEKHLVTKCEKIRVDFSYKEKTVDEI